MAPGIVLPDVESDGERWIGRKCRFEIVAERIELTGYQVYAVEKWYCITVTALSPVAGLTYPEAEAEFTAAVQHLRTHVGARPKECDSEATKDRFKTMYYFSDPLLTTSTYRSKSHSRPHTRALSHPVPSLSLSATASETLNFPTSTQSPVISLNHPNSSQTSTSAPLRHPHFTLYVLELIKIVQAALAICGMFPLPPPPIPGPMFDGLLCDVTVDGLRRWGAEIGEGFPGFEVSSTFEWENSPLAALAQGVPKDPFLHPHEYLVALTAYAQLQFPSGYSTGCDSGATTPPHTSAQSATTTSAYLPFAQTSTRLNIRNATPVYLTPALHSMLHTTHDKLRYADSRRVHKVILSRLDVGPTSEEDATDEDRRGLGERVMGLVGRTSAGAGSVGAPIADLGLFVKAVLSGRDREKERERERGKERERGRDRGSKDGESWKERLETVDEKEAVAGSLRTLWGGKVEALVRMRERLEERWVCSLPNEQEREGGKGKARKALSDVDDQAIKSNGEDDLTFGDVCSTGPVDADDMHQIKPLNEQMTRPRAALGEKNHTDMSLPRADSRLSRWDGWEDYRSIWKKSGRVLEEEIEVGPSIRGTLKRRHTFHDMDSIRFIRVLRLEWMRIDVELCGQIMVMRRREAHLQGVFECLEYLTNTLSRTNASLRMAHRVHKPIIDGLLTTAVTQGASSAQLNYSTSSPTLPSTRAVTATVEPLSLAGILQALPTLPPVAALKYETAQLRVGEIWAGTRALRTKVWQLRAQVFGDGTAASLVDGNGPGQLRRRPSRLRDRDRRLMQWTLDGGKRFVDTQGRTEEEAEEERCAGRFDTDTESFYDGERTETESEGGHEGVSVVGEEEDGDGEEEERQWVMPMWLLRMFTSWSSRLGFLRRGGPGAITPAGDTITITPKDGSPARAVAMQADDDAPAERPESHGDPAVA
ncbi:hypothetical protein ID866_3452 [Astraeus odoratus]|nr:hypothetical protein ID866_3452 [Astraeus odoratus]